MTNKNIRSRIEWLKKRKIFSSFFFDESIIIILCVSESLKPVLKKVILLTVNQKNGYIVRFFRYKNLKLGFRARIAKLITKHLYLQRKITVRQTIYRTKNAPLDK